MAYNDVYLRSTSDVITASIWNASNYYNQRYFKGKDGTIAFESAIDVTGNITVSGTVDGVDVAALSSNFATHDGGTAKAQHDGGAGDHTHQSTGAEGGQLDHGAALSGLGDDDHAQYLHLNKASQTIQQNVALGSGITIDGLDPSSLIKIGTYTGNGGTARQITVGFQCKYVKLIPMGATTFEQAVIEIIATSGDYASKHHHEWSDDAAHWHSAAGLLHATDGFVVNDGTGNDNGVTYWYMAIGQG